MNFTSVCNNSGSPGQSEVWLITLFSTYPSSSRCCVRKNKRLKKLGFQEVKIWFLKKQLPVNIVKIGYKGITC